MRTNLIIGFMALLLFATTACEKEGELTYSKGDIRINIETGDNWIDKFPLFLGITQDNAPQFAIWLEDTKGNYLSTVFVTKKIATEAWVSNGGNRRKEALPYWCYQRGVVYPDGLLLPTKDSPVTDATTGATTAAALPSSIDGITGATPKANKEIQIRLKDFNQPIVIKAEFNHSVDFNDFFPNTAKPGDANYSGGTQGSGQPAVIYADTIYPNQSSSTLKLIGRSSSDGTNGNVYTDLEKLTTAKTIVKSITIEIIK